MKHPDDGKHVVVQGGKRVSDLKPQQEAQQEADRINRENKVREGQGQPTQAPAQVKQNLYG